VSKIIPFSDLVRQQHLSLLEHRRREYQEREEYLAHLRRLLFQVEGQMREAEVLQLEIFNLLAKHFQVPLAFPGLRDRLEMQRLFAETPFLTILRDFFAGRLTTDACREKILALVKESAPASQEGSDEK